LQQAHLPYREREPVRQRPLSLASIGLISVMAKHNARPRFLAASIGFGLRDVASPIDREFRVNRP
jgi:hypothetical protein